MNIAFAGFRHSHIFGLYKTAAESSDVNIVGCFERDENARLSAEKSHGISFNYERYEEILNDTKIEAIAIGDYYGIRGEMIISALRAGKHVICDKPLCTSVAELDEIKQLTEEKGLSVACMLDLRYMGAAKVARELIQGGEIGKILSASFTGQHCLDYENRPTWYFEEGKHGGTLNDIAIHGVDLVRFITGKNLTKVSFAETKNAFAVKKPNFKDSARFVAEFEDMTVMADVSYSAPKFNGTLPTYWDFCFWGTEGLLHFNLKEGDIHIYKDVEQVIKCEGLVPRYLADFILEIEGRQTLMNTSDILRAQRETLLIQEAVKV